MTRLSAALRSVAAGVRRGWWWMLSIALLAALASTAMPVTTPAAGAHTTSAPMLIKSNGVTPSPEVDEVVATMRAIAASEQVRADIAERAGVADAGRSAVSILPVGIDRIDVTAADTDPAVAQRVARATRDAVLAAFVIDQRTTRTASVAALRTQLTAADNALAASKKGSTDQQVLQAQRDTLVRAVATAMADPGPTLVAGPAPVLAGSTPPAPTSPFPIPAPLLALLVLVALALAVPLLRASRGKLPDAAPAAWATRRLGVPAVEVGARRSPSLDLAELYRFRLRHLRRVTVVQLTRPAACDLGAELVRTAALNGDDRTHDDCTPGSRRVPGNRRDSPVVRTLRTTHIDRDTARTLLDAGPTVLVVQTATARRASIARDVSLLRGVGADVVAVAVWRGRVPFDPARPWAPPSVDPDGAAHDAAAPEIVEPQLRIPRQVQPTPSPVTRSAPSGGT